MRVVSVVGARPQFVKLAPVANRLAIQRDVEHIIVHTGQHYDQNMSDIFFRDLGIAMPDVNLEIGSGTHAFQTGSMICALEGVLTEYLPDWVVVYGDTNSTLAATLTAVKIHLPVAHIEAGLRSFNRRMPEEHNRVLTDHAADLLLAPTHNAWTHLAREGLAERTVVVGDVMADICLLTRKAVVAESMAPPGGVECGRPYVIATLHRAENTDDRVRLSQVIEGLRTLTVPVFLLAHPRLVSRAANFGIALDGGSLYPIDPLGYPQTVRAVMGAVGVVTDSGGLQKEAFLLNVPCTTLRTETEWVETLEHEWNILDPALERLGQVAVRRKPEGVKGEPYGNGAAAENIVTALRKGLGSSKL